MLHAGHALLRLYLDICICPGPQEPRLNALPVLVSRPPSYRSQAARTPLLSHVWHPTGPYDPYEPSATHIPPIIATKHT